MIVIDSNEMRHTINLMTLSKIPSFCFCAAIALGLATSAGATTMTIGGSLDGNQGMMTSVAGATTITFNGNTTLPNGFTASGTNPANPLVQGSHGNLYKAPSGDTSTYLTTGTGTIVDTLSTPATYFGFYWGSPDESNHLKITESNGKTFTINGDGLDPDCRFSEEGDNGSYYVNFFADAGTTFKSVEFSSCEKAFEFDNVATASATPEPATITIMAGGLLICAGSLRRRKA